MASGGGHWNWSMYGFQASVMHPTRMLSCCHLFLDFVRIFLQNYRIRNCLKRKRIILLKILRFKHSQCFVFCFIKFLNDVSFLWGNCFGFLVMSVPCFKSQWIARWIALTSACNRFLRFTSSTTPIELLMARAIWWLHSLLPFIYELSMQWVWIHDIGTIWLATRGELVWGCLNWF